MTNPPPLSVDPEQLGLAGGQLLEAAGQLPLAPPPFMPTGTDPLSLAIIGQIPAVEAPVMTQLPLVQAQSTSTAQSVVGAAQAYSTTDQQLGGDIGKEMQNPATAAGAGGSSAGGGAGSMSQMMSMPMQMASQMAQMPMQAMGAVAAVPQGIMQGVQQVGQQVQQMVGQVGQSGGAGGGVGGQGGSGAAGPANGATHAPGPDVPGTDRPQDHKTEGGQPEEDDRKKEHDGAAAGQPGGERAPDSKGDVGDHAQAPARHRVDETDDSINL